MAAPAALRVPLRWQVPGGPSVDGPCAGPKRHWHFGFIRLTPVRLEPLNKFRGCLSDTVMASRRGDRRAYAVIQRRVTR
ncbi:MAG: hypothetical protein ACREUU_02070, partial [Gammaproteobacteria bacterium]